MHENFCLLWPIRPLCSLAQWCQWVRLQQNIVFRLSLSQSTYTHSKKIRKKTQKPKKKFILTTNVLFTGANVILPTCSAASLAMERRPIRRRACPCPPPLARAPRPRLPPRHRPAVLARRTGASHRCARHRCLVLLKLRVRRARGSCMATSACSRRSPPSQYYASRRGVVTGCEPDPVHVQCCVNAGTGARPPTTAPVRVTPAARQHCSLTAQPCRARCPKAAH